VVATGLTISLSGILLVIIIFNFDDLHRLFLNFWLFLG
jgi:hypothetical protein